MPRCHFVVYYFSCASEEKGHAIYFISGFLRPATFSYLFFFEVLASSSSALGVFVVVFTFWQAPEAASRRSGHPSGFRDRNSCSWESTGIENADWKKATDSQIFLWCDVIWKGILFFQWQLTEDKQTVFHWKSFVFLVLRSRILT